MEHQIEDYFEKLSELLNVEQAEIEGYWNDLTSDQIFLQEINRIIHNVPEFSGKQFTHVGEMRVFRCLLYLLTRIKKPETFIETGVHNGMSSAFILLAMLHNQKGDLYSIDLPPIDQRILDQGTNDLPKDKEPGWIIPDYLRTNHKLTLEYAQIALPDILHDLGNIDLFLHDSDHDYTHIMFEIGLVWHYLIPMGLVIIDNIEQNNAFADFSRGTSAPSLSISSFLGQERTWQHGIIQKLLS